MSSDTDKQKAISDFGSILNAVLSRSTAITDDDIQRMVWEKAGIMIARGGNKITLPEGMTYEQARSWLHRKEEEEESIIALNEDIHGYPLDAALAFTKALSRVFGWSSMVSVPAGFWGTLKPEMIGVQTSTTDTVQVPWGRFKIPNIDGWIETDTYMKDGAWTFYLRGEVRRKHSDTVKNLAEVARDILREESIYKGRAITVKFPDGQFRPTDHAPKFLDLGNICREELIFPRETEHLIESALFAPILHTQACRSANIPLKRGVLLEGAYGTGKTLTANVVGKLCEENGWTFLYIKELEDLPAAVELAARYQPAVVFAEDIDRVVDTERSDISNVILNTIDGVDAKDREVMVVLTTNFVEKIDKAMLRPGRLDAVIPIRPADAESIGRLIKLFCGDLLPPEADLSKVGELLNGQIPAVVREVVERAKLAAICRTNNDDEQLLLQSIDLEMAAEGMHLYLLESTEVEHVSKVAEAAGVLGTAIGTAVRKELSNTKKKNGHRSSSVRPTA